MTSPVEKVNLERELGSYNIRVIRGERPPIAVLIWFAVRDRDSKTPRIVKALAEARRQYKLTLADPAIRKWTLDEIRAYLANIRNTSTPGVETRQPFK